MVQQIRQKLAAEPPRRSLMPEAAGSRATSKYSAKAIIVDGWRFDSKLEARRYGQLQLLQAAGQIRYVLRQVPFWIAPRVRYVVDFGVCQLDWTIRWEDVKGVLTDTSRTKIATVERLYGIEIHLLTREDLR
jgi:hypothetical protein